jgi:hypothetical protein
MPRFLRSESVLSIFEDHQGEILSVRFIKRTTGEERLLVGRAGVKKYVKGVGLSYDPKSRNLITIYDMALAAKLPENERAKAYRSIPTDAVLEIRAGHITHLP